MDFGKTIDLILMGCGVYFLYSWWTMKHTGEVNRTILLGSGFDSKRCVDKKAYLKTVLPKVLILSVVAMFSGICNMINDLYFKIFYIGTAITILCLLTVMWYAITTGKAAREYYR